MADPEISANPLTVLEQNLVSEFRAYQELLTLSQSERQVLAQGDLQALPALNTRKEHVLREIDGLDGRRQATLSAWASQQARPAPGSLLDLLPHLEAAAAARFARLREGILALIEQYGELARGNQLLVATALERLAGTRELLLRLSDAPAGYRPPGLAAPASAAPALSVEHWA
jgi:hypothetical protein